MPIRAHPLFNLCVGTAALHYTGLGYITGLAADAPAELRPLVPLLWLSFSVNLLVLALLLAEIARDPMPAHRTMLILVTLGPLGGAALQIRYVGFIAPTAILLVDAAVVLAAAAVLSRTPGSPEA